MLPESPLERAAGLTCGRSRTDSITGLLASPIEGLGLVFENAMAPIYEVFGST